MAHFLKKSSSHRKPPARPLALFAAASIVSLALAPAHAQETPEPAAAETATDAATDAATGAAAETTETALIDYSKIDEFFDGFSIKKGDRRQFRYAQLQRQAVQTLGAYSTFLANLKPSTFSENEQLAYWLNLRNILVVRAIADETPRRSLKAARGTFDDPGEMWTRKRLAVEGEQMSIHAIEQKILQNFSDPNVLYGLYQGIEDGPALNAPAMFSGPTVNEQLQERAKFFVNARRVMSVKKTALRAPGVYEWYKPALFNDSDDAVLAHLKAHAGGDLQAALADAEKIDFRKITYRIDAAPAPRQVSDFNRAPRGGFTGGGGSGS